MTVGKGGRGGLLANFMPSVCNVFEKTGRAILPAHAQLMAVILGALTGLLLSLLGQFGDLAESIWKRDAGVKDSGGYIPGMGGVLDVLDSLLFTAPAMYLLMKVMENV